MTMKSLMAEVCLPCNNRCNTSFYYVIPIGHYVTLNVPLQCEQPNSY